MKTNKRNIFVQLLSGIFSSLVFLHIGYLLSEKLTLPQTNLSKYGEPIIFMAYILIFMVFTSLTAILSKTYNLKHLYYSFFGVFFVSTISALASWYLDDTLFLILFPFVKNLGYPITAIARVMQKITTYTVDWFDGYTTYPVDETILYENDTIVIFLIITLVSIAIHQLHTETYEHETALKRWKLNSPARGLAFSIIFGYGGFISLITVLDHIPYDKFNTAIDIMYHLLSITCITLTLTMITFALPVVLISCLFISSIQNAKQQKNPRQVFNPLVLLAVYLTCYGTYTIYETTMSCF